MLYSNRPHLVDLPSDIYHAYLGIRFNYPVIFYRQIFNSDVSEKYEKVMNFSVYCCQKSKSNEPCCEKTCLQGFLLFAYVKNRPSHLVTNDSSIKLRGKNNGRFYIIRLISP